MKKEIILAFLTSLTVALIVSLSGCSDARRAEIAAWGCKHRVTAYSGGKQIGQWVSSGKIGNEAHSDGYIFKDDATGKLIRVSGDVLIEVL